MGGLYFYLNPSMLLVEEVDQSLVKNSLMTTITTLYTVTNN